MPWSHLALVGDRLLATMSSTNTFAPGNVVVVRDEEWLVTSVDESSDGPVLNAQGLSDLVRGQDAVFYPSLDRITLNDPRDTTVRPDDSPRYRRSRLWVESTLRKTAVPLSDDSLTVSPRMLARQLGYQHKAVAKALDPATLRRPGMSQGRHMVIYLPSSRGDLP